MICARFVILRQGCTEHGNGAPSLMEVMLFDSDLCTASLASAESNLTGPVSCGDCCCTGGADRSSGGSDGCPGRGGRLGSCEPGGLRSKANPQKVRARSLSSSLAHLDTRNQCCPYLHCAPRSKCQFGKAAQVQCRGGSEHTPPSN